MVGWDGAGRVHLCRKEDLKNIAYELLRCQSKPHTYTPLARASHKSTLKFEEAGKYSHSIHLGGPPHLASGHCSSFLHRSLKMLIHMLGHFLPFIFFNYYYYGLYLRCTLHSFKVHTSSVLSLILGQHSLSGLKHLYHRLLK
jgi:hypothetical protein